jgi:2-phosphosulfolactate phosphatase
MLLDRGRPITLLCAGTGGAFAIEDALGAGAVIHAIERDGSLDLANDSAQAAHALFLRLRDDLPGVLTRSQGGRNIAEAGLADDIAFAARLDRYAITAEVDMPTLAIRRHPHADP